MSMSIQVLFVNVLGGSVYPLMDPTQHTLPSATGHQNIHLVMHQTPSSPLSYLILLIKVHTHKHLK
jgi:hypothetical protein